MDFLQTLLDNSTVPAFTAFILGILTAVSPCPLATNITAVGYVGKDIDSSHRIFINGLLYTLGRTFSYTILGIILISLLRAGANIFAVKRLVSEYGAMLTGPALIVIGLLMLDVLKLNLPKLNIGADRLKNISRNGLGAILLGILFALAFCPTSGLLYFGMLIPMAAAESGGYLLPAIYAIATGLPVVLAAWIIAYSVAGLGRFYNRMQTFEKWFRRITALLFIGIGAYYTIALFI